MKLFNFYISLVMKKVIGWFFEDELSHLEKVYAEQEWGVADQDWVREHNSQ